MSPEGNSQFPLQWKGNACDSDVFPWVTGMSETISGRGQSTDLDTQIQLTRRTPSTWMQAIHDPGVMENGSAEPAPGTVTKAGSLLGGKFISLL